MSRFPVPSALRTLLLAAPLLAMGACTPAAPPPSAPAPAPAAPAAGRTAIAAALDSVFADTLFARASWGVAVRSLDASDWVYRRNAERMFVPASNMKVVTGVAALEVLGPEFRYATPVVAAGRVEGGVLHGDLVVVGSGDPSIGARFGGDPRAVFRAWADSLKARDIVRVTGRVVGDDDAFDDVPLGRGWAWDDAEAAYSAEIGALQLNDGYVSVTVAPGDAPGQPLRVALDPATAYVPVLSSAVTGERGSAATLAVGRQSEGAGVRVTGTLPPGAAPVTATVAVRNNTAYFVEVLRETLVEAGIRVEGGAVDLDTIRIHRLDPLAGAPRDTLFVHRSPPLPAVLAAFLKPSQNQYGELLLKTLGVVRSGNGTAAAGIAVVDSLSRAWGLPARALSQADGSGLSRYNLVAPEYLVAMLEHESRSPHAAVFRAALPVAGVDGTLETRMRGTPLAGNVRAKTGTLSGIRALSGYLTTAAGERVVFSIVVNHHTLSARDADRVTEAALLRLHAMPRP